jgi:hypothetical protein
MSFGGKGQSIFVGGPNEYSALSRDHRARDFLPHQSLCRSTASTDTQFQSAKSAAQIPRITAGELKSKLSTNEAVTILDVRDTNAMSTAMIKSKDQFTSE